MAPGQTWTMKWTLRENFQHSAVLPALPCVVSQPSPIPAGPRLAKCGLKGLWDLGACGGYVSCLEVSKCGGGGLTEWGTSKGSGCRATLGHSQVTPGGLNFTWVCGLFL